MSRISAQFRTGSSRPSAFLFSVALLVCAFTLSGCILRPVRPKPFPWGTVANTRPYPPLPVDATSEAAPDLQPEMPPPPSPLVAMRSTPARPRPPAGSPPTNEPPNNKPDVPRIAPQLTAQEASAAQQQMNESLSIAERNIGATQGKNLNPTQLDLASKVRNFIAEARQAANVGDWTRARNAAKKAQVLSEELASSLS
jgi:hypothetical protein